MREAGAADGPGCSLRTSLGRHRRGGRAAAHRRRAGRRARWPTCADATGAARRPVDTHVQRWGGGLPQYAVGHLDRVARIRADVAQVPGLAVCGAAYDGVGIPAVIASAHAAAARRACWCAARWGQWRAMSSRAAEQTNAARLREINDIDPLHHVVGLPPRHACSATDADRAAEGAEVEKLFAELAEADVVVRGVYDVSGLRADADVMVWWHASESRGRCRPPTTASAARRSAGGSPRSGRRWRCTARPSSTRATSRRSWATRSRRRTCASTRSCRSYEWYLLPRTERRDMLAEHGKMARPYADVRANTVARFALGDYEWMLAFEADELHRIVDLMRDLRASAPVATCARRSRSTPAPASRSATSSTGCPDPDASSLALVGLDQQTGTGTGTRSASGASYGHEDRRRRPVPRRSARRLLDRGRDACRRPGRIG